MRGRKKLIFGLLGLLAVLGCLAVAVAVILQFHKAGRVLEEQKRLAGTKNLVALRNRGFSLAPDPDARLLVGPPQIRDICRYHDRLYAASSTGLLVFSEKGDPLEHWTTAEGLPSLDLTSIAVQGDSLWVGTADSGLLRLYHGSWQQFLPDPLPLRRVKTLLATSQGSLFAGTDDGLLIYANDRFERFGYTGLKGASVTCLASDSGNLYIGTFAGGLYVYENGTLHRYGREQGLLDLYITDLTPGTAAGDVYLATPLGIQRFSAGGQRVDDVARNLFSVSLQYEPPVLWAGTMDRGIVPLKVPDQPGQQQQQQRRKAEFRPDGAMPSTLPVKLKKLDDQLLAFSGGRSFHLVEKRGWQAWNREADYLADGNISALLRRPSGDLWVGYFDHGIDIVAEDRPVRHLQDSTFFCINYLSQDSAGRVYASTANGLAIVQPDGSVTVVREKDGLLSDRVMQAIPLDPDGKRVAIATAQGFSVKEGPDIKSLYAFNGLVNNHVYSVAPEGDNIYVGTLGGISTVYNNNMSVGQSWTHMDSSLRQNWVNALLSVDRRLFVGMYGAGLQARTQSGDWITFDQLPDRFEVNGNALYADDRYLFCGTLDRGFYYMDRKTMQWRQFREQPLPGSNVTAFAGGPPGFLYVATDRGLLRLKYDKLSTIATLR